MKQVDLQGNIWDCNIGNIEPPISAYGSINLDELNRVIERLNKVPDYDVLIRDNNKKQQEIEKLNKIIEIKNNRIQQLMKRTRGARIDKAIKIIKEEPILHDSYYGEDAFLEDLFKDYHDKLISALKGDDKE